MVLQIVCLLSLCNKRQNHSYMHSDVPADVVELIFSLKNNYGDYSFSFLTVSFFLKLYIYGVLTIIDS